jgi:hypothetical protein
MVNHPRRSKRPPIRVGDKFKIGADIYEVTETKPGGKVTLLNREKSRFWDTYTSQMRDLERA